jgi:NADH-quinone oxidoreductase subunit M
VAATGVILAAAYLLWMFQRTMFNDRGDAEIKPATPLADLNLREIVTLVPLVALVIWVGVYPATVLNYLHMPVDMIMLRVTPALSSEHANVLAQLVDTAKGLF